MKIYSKNSPFETYSTCKSTNVSRCVKRCPDMCPPWYVPTRTFAHPRQKKCLPHARPIRWYALGRDHRWDDVYVAIYAQLSGTTQEASVVGHAHPSFSVDSRGMLYRWTKQLLQLTSSTTRVYSRRQSEWNATVKKTVDEFCAHWNIVFVSALHNIRQTFRVLLVNDGRSCSDSIAINLHVVSGFRAAYTCVYACWDIFIITYRELACRSSRFLSLLERK